MQVGNESVLESVTKSYACKNKNTHAYFMFITDDFHPRK